jgi:Fe2+ transport system protein FeoA
MGVNNTVSLDLLAINSSGKISHIRGNNSFRRRLLEHGFLPGIEISLVGIAPMGDPLEVKIRGAYFTLRKEEAKLILLNIP